MSNITDMVKLSKDHVWVLAFFYENGYVGKPLHQYDDFMARIDSVKEVVSDLMEIGFIERQIQNCTPDYCNFPYTVTKAGAKYIERKKPEINRKEPEFVRNRINDVKKALLEEMKLRKILP